jgi:surface polysaccharide O-acyltransferase-like enzyme
MLKDRDLSFDAFRGLAIIAVVAIHAAYLGFSIRTAPNGQWIFFFLVAYCQLLNFAVPAFVFISGYWQSKKPIESLKDYRVFLVRRLSRILVPYFFWSVILLGYAAIRAHEVDAYRIIFKLMTGRAAVPYYPYYFIIVIAQLYILTPLLSYINRKPYGLILVVVLNVLGLLALYLSRLKVIWHLPVTLPFYLWIVFYEMGLLTGTCADRLFSFKKLHSLILPGILISILVSEMEGFAILSRFNDTFFAVSITKYSSFLYSVFVILGFLVLRERISRWPGFLVTLGKYSFGIYLIHIIILARVTELISKIDIVYLFQPAYQLIAVLLTLLICLVLIVIARRLLPESFCERVLGF